MGRREEGSTDTDKRERDRERRFEFVSVVSRTRDISRAMTELAVAVGRQDASRPDFIALYYGTGRVAEEVHREAVEAFGVAALHGGSSCLGVMSSDGAAIASGDAIGLCAIRDPDGDYGTASECMGKDARMAAAHATRQALRRADRAGEVPDLVWLTAAPGREEAVLAGIKDVVGQSALIVGASAADNEIAGNWSQVSPDGVAREAVVVSVMFPSVPIACTFDSGYAPTGKHGTVTRAEGRVLHEIDGRSAVDVYESWTGRRVRPDKGKISILSEASMAPLGRVVSELDGIPFHVLAHPAVAHADGRLELFADLADGQEIWLMESSEDSLVERAGLVANASRARLAGCDVAGGLVVYCGGCMLAVRPRMEDVSRSVSEALGRAPFLGIFSFGEQGETVCGESRHSNLMISCVLFGRESDPGNSERK